MTNLSTALVAFYAQAPGYTARRKAEMEMRGGIYPTPQETTWRRG